MPGGRIKRRAFACRAAACAQFLYLSGDTLQPLRVLPLLSLARRKQEADHLKHIISGHSNEANKFTPRYGKYTLHQIDDHTVERTHKVVLLR